MSDLRFLLRYVHRKLHELSDRGTRYGTSRKRNDPGSLFRENQTCKTCRYGSYGYVPQKYPSKRYHDKRCHLKRIDCRYGTGLFLSLIHICKKFKENDILVQNYGMVTNFTFLPEELLDDIVKYGICLLYTSYSFSSL